jgi:ArsR family transcriptional regulator
MNVSVQFAALGDPGRLRVACCLVAGNADGLCVCELVDALDERQPNVSRDLKALKDAGLVEERRDGRWIYYRLRDPDNPLFESIRACLASACACEPTRHDLDRLRARLAQRAGGKCVVGLRRAKGGDTGVRLPVV